MRLGAVRCRLTRLPGESNRPHSSAPHHLRRLSLRYGKHRRAIERHVSDTSPLRTRSGCGARPSHHRATLRPPGRHQETWTVDDKPVVQPSTAQPPPHRTGILVQRRSLMAALGATAIGLPLWEQPSPPTRATSSLAAPLPYHAAWRRFCSPSTRGRMPPLKTPTPRATSGATGFGW